MDKNIRRGNDSMSCKNYTTSEDKNEIKILAKSIEKKESIGKISES
ncbi:hypothetical protein LGK98_05950 [Clostridium tagluense]|nr:hypothetical protein [Clostridium tagluense]MBU3128273.1 hypothetical protein [Clostridium tagluense]MCB2320365.1 hypothetical protein [Clostridium tagluense]MCB2335062.1 hypothetical protein [Clostridium tagluense]